jgi:hypothetical protein
VVCHNPFRFIGGSAGAFAGIGFLGDKGWGVVGLVWANKAGPKIMEAATMESNEAFILYPFRQSF